MLVGSAAFLAVEGLVAVVAFRRRRAVDVSVDAPLPSRTFEAVWMLTPAVLLVGLVGWSAHVLGGRVGAVPGEPEVTVHVAGKGFAWHVSYEVKAEDGSTRLVDAGYNRVHLPVGRPARIVLVSEDRVHGFWVPQLRVKQDALPGHPVDVRVQPLEQGEFNIVCATLCGDQHYAMRGFVQVEPVEDFEQWLAAR